MSDKEQKVCTLPGLTRLVVSLKLTILQPLQHKYDVWFRGINRGKVVPNSQNYDQNLKIVASFDTVQSFWSVYTHLVRPNDLTGHCDLHVFKSGIKPLWEDPANRDGGMWKLRLRKGKLFYDILIH